MFALVDSKTGGKMKDYLAAWRRFAEFSGRSRRREYWLFQLGNLLALGILILCGFAFSADGASIEIIRISAGLYVLLIFVPALSCSIRRLHDIGFSGWWVLIGLVPSVGGLALLVFHVLDSEPGSNKYGPNPKEPQTAQAVS